MVQKISRKVKEKLSGADHPHRVGDNSNFFPAYVLGEGWANQIKTTRGVGTQSL